MDDAQRHAAGMADPAHGARRRPRRSRRRRDDAAHRGVPGPDHALCLGRDLDPPGSRPAQPPRPGDRHDGRARPLGGAADARPRGARRRRLERRRDQGEWCCSRRSTAACRPPTTRCAEAGGRDGRARRAADQAVAMPHHTTDDGCRLAYALAGPRAAPPLVLSNSLGTDRGLWDRQIDALRRAASACCATTRAGTARRPRRPATTRSIALGRDVLLADGPRRLRARARLRRVDRRADGAVARRARAGSRATAWCWPTPRRGSDRSRSVDRADADRRQRTAWARWPTRRWTAGSPRRSAPPQPDVGGADPGDVPGACRSRATWAAARRCATPTCAPEACAGARAGRWS